MNSSESILTFSHVPMNRLSALSYLPTRPENYLKYLIGYCIQTMSLLVNYKLVLIKSMSRTGLNCVRKTSKQKIINYK